MAFLRDRHRHLFHVRVEWRVSHEDREREFFLEKWQLHRDISTLKDLAEEEGDWSCERWAREILEMTGAFRVEVSEDGENGAVVSRQ